MSGKLLRRIGVVVLLVLGQLLMPLPAVLAQTRPRAGSSDLPAGTRADLRGKTVESVRILGNTTVSTAVILNLVRTREGDKFDPATVEMKET